MKKSMIALALALALVAAACSQDVTESDEYQALELEVAELEQQLSETEPELSEAQDMLDEAAAGAAGGVEVPPEVLALLDEWWAANERNDGSVVDLYTPAGYHLYGETKYSLDNLAAHLNRAVSPEWVTEPYLVVSQPMSGRYVVTRGLKSGTKSSALTFEIVTDADGDLKLAQSAWILAH
jgi:hypothetical protein